MPEVRGSKRSECGIPPGTHGQLTAASHGTTSTVPPDAATTAATTSSFCARVRLRRVKVHARTVSEGLPSW